MERIDLTAVHSACRQRWRNGGEWDQAATKVLVGEVTDGRWYVRRYDGGEPQAIAYAGPRAEWLARRAARCWMRTIGGTWVEA